MQKTIESYENQISQLKIQMKNFMAENFTYEEIVSEYHTHEYNIQHICQIINNLFFHKPYTNWNENTLKSAFLIKYSSSAAYDRL